MSMVHEGRASDSPYIERVTRGRTLGSGTTIRPSETHWHMVVRRINSRAQLLVVGPLTASGCTSWGEGAELLWIKFKLGTFMPHLPTKNRLDQEIEMPDAAHRSFWLHSDTWALPDFENVETFVDQLVRKDVLLHDPLVNDILLGRPHDLSERTLRHRFLQATGLSHGHIRQYQRAQHAATLLDQGKSILDTVHEAGYFDQPHLTKAMRRYLGTTPAQHISATSLT